MPHAAHAARTGLTILGCFSGGSLYGWSGYMPAVQEHFAVSNAAVSMVFSVALFCFTLGVLLAPFLLARLSLQLRLPLLAMLAVLSLCFAGASASFPGFVLSYGACFGFVSGALYNHAISRAAASASATLLVPVSVAAFGLGGAVFGPLHVWLTASGWALWSVLPATVCFAVVAVFSLLFSRGDAMQRPAAPMAWARPDLNTAILGGIFAAASCAGLIVLGFASQILPHGAEGVGLASLAIFLAAIGNTSGRLSSAVTAARFGPAKGIAGALVLSMISLGGLILASSSGVIVGLLFLVAFAYGQIAATMPLLVKSQVRAPEFSGAFGWVFVGWGAAGLIGPWTAGWLLDVSGTMRFALALCIALVALSLWLVLRFTKLETAEASR